ncbi:MULTISPECIES: hypothetical protein [Clostridium]|uniref:hypothetical protein n=1 Tax=Clostridium TaxID=1485 RepID=UPI0005F98F9D|nr:MULTISPECIES: hypothetical protein [Clostridium]APF26283.1 hypothetical protein NPD7_2600 [Clostridium sporogenes]MDI6918644.1 hypothetical protein [Clostridium botulinum]WMU98188.1 hypothetical protein QA656_02670 [Clostridium botulinum]
MNKNITKFLGSALIFSSVLFSAVSVSAANRKIGELHNFRLPAHQGVVSTGYLTKIRSNSPWVLNVTNLKNTGSVDTYLANSNGSRRSDYTRVGRGRHQISSSATAGYSYKAILMNTKGQTYDAYISGSWSPDTK